MSFEDFLYFDLLNVFLPSLPNCQLYVFHIKFPMFSHQVLNVFPNMFPIDHHNFCPKFNNLYSKALLSSCFGSGSSYWGWCCLNFKVSNSLSNNLGCTSQLLEMPFTHQMQSSRHKFVGGIERKLCCFLPGCDHCTSNSFD
jgi:hypothetical protein